MSNQKYEDYLSDRETVEINKRGQDKYIKFFNKSDHQCINKECKEIATASHAISKEISLSWIAPERNMKYFESSINGKNSKTLKLKNIGINDATTFKGFCQPHDSMFKFLDENKYKYTDRQILLQCYRSICYVWFRSKYLEYTSHDLKSSLKNKILNEDYIVSTLSRMIKEGSEFDEKSVRKLLDLLQNNEDFTHKLLQEAKFSIDDKINRHNHEYDLFTDLKNRMEIFLNYRTHENEGVYSQHAIDSKSIKVNGVSVKYKRIDISIPVAMLNHHYFDYDGQRVFLLFTVVPYDNGTELFWIYDSNYDKILTEKWNQMLSSALNILNRIESSMMSCENWFINPDTLYRIPKKRLKIITEDLYFSYERNMFEDYELSLFDDIRRNLLEGELEQIKMKESAKFKEDVCRESYNERKLKYNDKVMQLYIR